MCTVSPTDRGRPWRTPPGHPYTAETGTYGHTEHTVTQSIRTDRQTDRQADRRTGGQADRRTDRQTEQTDTVVRRIRADSSDRRTHRTAHTAHTHRLCPAVGHAMHQSGSQAWTAIHTDQVLQQPTLRLTDAAAAEHEHVQMAHSHRHRHDTRHSTGSAPTVDTRLETSDRQPGTGAIDKSGAAEMA